MCSDVVVKLHRFDAIAQSDMADILPHMKNHKSRSRTDCFHLIIDICNSSYITLVNIYLTYSVFSHVLAWDTDTLVHNNVRFASDRY